jgi:hypothetical protein
MQDLGFSQRVDKDSSLFGQILAEDGNSKLLRNVRSYLPIDMASCPRRSKHITKILTACTQMFQNERALALTSPTGGGGRSVGIVRPRT